MTTSQSSDTAKRVEEPKSQWPVCDDCGVCNVELWPYIIAGNAVHVGDDGEIILTEKLLCNGCANISRKNGWTVKRSLEVEALHLRLHAKEEEVRALRETIELFLSFAEVPAKPGMSEWAEGYNVAIDTVKDYSRKALSRLKQPNVQWSSDCPWSMKPVTDCRCEHCKDFNLPGPSGGCFHS